MPIPLILLSINGIISDSLSLEYSFAENTFLAHDGSFFFSIISWYSAAHDKGTEYVMYFCLSYMVIGSLVGDSINDEMIF